MSRAPLAKTAGHIWSRGDLRQQSLCRTAALGGVCEAQREGKLRALPKTGENVPKRLREMHSLCLKTTMEEPWEFYCCFPNEKVETSLGEVPDVIKFIIIDNCRCICDIRNGAEHTGKSVEFAPFNT